MTVTSDDLPEIRAAHLLDVLDLFSGIGGFSLGLERTGKFRTVAFVEIDDYCDKVLAKHWPEVRRYRDVRNVNQEVLIRDGIERPSVICGGFPCQDISVAGLGAGLGGERSGLWAEYARIIGEIHPQWAIVENVSALRSRGLDRVLGDLASLGYDAEWHCIPASAVGAPHQRDRIWIVAHPNSSWELQSEGSLQEQWGRSGDRRQALADANGPRLEVWKSVGSHNGEERSTSLGNRWWPSEPDVGRVAHGVPSRVDRLRCLGNSLVPQVAELIGRAIVNHDCRNFNLT